MLPLHNRRILVTRPRGQSSILATQLEALGADVIQIPTIEIVPPSSYTDLDAAIASATEFEWLIFTSANAVEVFAGRADKLGLRPKPNRIAVIGLATARAVQFRGLAERVDLMPPRAVSESLVEALAPHALNSKMLLIRAAAARNLLPESLREAGAHVTVAEAYRTVVPQGTADKLWDLFTSIPPDAITFTSASTVHNLQEILKAVSLEVPRGTVLASIGSITSHAMREHNLEPSLEAPEATIPSLVHALSIYLQTGDIGRSQPIPSR